MQYKVIFIDWDGTLSNSRFWDRWRDTPQYDLIQNTLFLSKEGRLVVNDWMLGFRSYVTVLQYVSGVTGIAYDDLATELQYSAENMKFIDDKAIAMIQKLREKGAKVLLATDNMDTFRIWTVPALKLESLFDGILVSDTRGAMKSHLNPDGSSAFFHHYLSQNGLKPEETVLIDDNLSTKIVEQFGMNFLHVNEGADLAAHLGDVLRK